MVISIGTSTGVQFSKLSSRPGARGRCSRDDGERFGHGIEGEEHLALGQRAGDADASR
jgi:hypothetical protein